MSKWKKEKLSNSTRKVFAYTKNKYNDNYGITIEYDPHFHSLEVTSGNINYSTDSALIFFDDKEHAINVMQGLLDIIKENG